MVTMALNSMTRVRGKPQHPVLFLLDEMPALGYLAPLERAAGLMAGAGMRLFMVTQNIPLIKNLYESWETFLSNCGAQIFMTIKDPTTTDYFTQMTGNTTQNEGHDRLISVPVVSPEILHILPPGSCMVIYKGLTQTFAPGYWELPELAGLYDPDPEQQGVPAEQKPPVRTDNTGLPPDLAGAKVHTLGETTAQLLLADGRAIELELGGFTPAQIEAIRNLPRLVPTASTDTDLELPPQLADAELCGLGETTAKLILANGRIPCPQGVKFEYLKVLTGADPLNADARGQNPPA
jgi:hypothetical protein